VVQRPHATAGDDAGAPRAWPPADLVFLPQVGWRSQRPLDPWRVAIDNLTLELRPTDSAQVGLFPEHARTWPWLRDRVQEAGAATGDRSAPTILHLFAYTGATTLVLAAAGAAVAHVDAARPSVAWARRNAELSGLSDRPIRWLVDDAAAFVARELRRGRRYDGVILDPPSYGHGGGGRTWRLETDLDDLLDGCAALIGGSAGFVLLTAHTPGFEADRLAASLGFGLGVAARRIESGPLLLEATSGATLALGAFARWPGAR
jgi:23S rRNA (cytosine1962-C5)-methyltransferase